MSSNKDAFRISVVKLTEEEYERIFAKEMKEFEDYVDILQSVDYGLGLMYAQFVFDERMRIRKIHEALKGMGIVVEAFEEISNPRIEWESDGFVYDRIIGDKKTYRFQPILPPILVCNHVECVEAYNDFPSFEIALDRVFVMVRKGKRVLRRFWSRKGKVRIFLAYSRNGKEERVQIGELKVKFVGFMPVDPKAMEKVRRLAKVMKKLKLKRKNSSGKEKAELTRQIKKLEERIRNLVRRAQPHIVARLVVEEKIEGVSLRRTIYAMRFKEYVAEGGKWKIIYVDDESELRKWINEMEKKWEGIVNERFVFYGNRGPMNHELRVLSKPGKRIEVETLTQARESVWRLLVKVKKHPIKVEEYVSKDGKRKAWIISPVENAARFVIVNRDHKHENLHRVMCQVKRGRYVAFIHEL